MGGVCLGGPPFLVPPPPQLCPAIKFKPAPPPPALVNFHLLNSAQCSEAIMAGSVFETAEGSTVEIGCDGDSLTVNGIKMVLKKDIVTTNGVIHLIDRVLIPDSGKQPTAM